MIGVVSSNSKVMGHTGSGPGSVIAVYHHPEGKPRFTAAAFAFGDDEGQVEGSGVQPGRVTGGSGDKNCHARTCG
jgi:hypothetical protein